MIIETILAYSMLVMIITFTGMYWYAKALGKLAERNEKISKFFGFHLENNENTL